MTASFFLRAIDMMTSPISRAVDGILPMPRTPFVLLITTLFFACGEPTGSAVEEVRFSVSPDELLSGDPLVATVENRSSEDVTLHFCDLVIQQRPASGWDPAGRAPDRPAGTLCAMAPLVLSPGSTDRRVAPFSHALDPGSYRLWLRIEVANADTMIPSPEFRVRE